jgi:hypothetical protein
MERQVRERDALQLVDVIAQRLDHPVNLAVLAFVDRDREPRVFALAGKHFDFSRQRDRAVVELHAIAQLLDMLWPDLAVHFDVIRLRHVTRRREQLRRELAIVRQQQHALGVEVEPAHRLHGHR